MTWNDSLDLQLGHEFRWHGVAVARWDTSGGFDWADGFRGLNAPQTPFFALWLLAGPVAEEQSMIDVPTPHADGTYRCPVCGAVYLTATESILCALSFHGEEEE